MAEGDEVDPKPDEKRTTGVGFFWLTSRPLAVQHGHERSSHPRNLSLLAQEAAWRLFAT
jgi:hypothetical protein